MKRYWFRGAIVIIVLLLAAGFVFSKYSSEKQQDGDESEAQVPQPVVANQGDFNNIPKDSSALGGFNVLIADRGNNRLIEVTPDKKIVWEYQFNLPKLGLGADDSFWTDGGKKIIVNLEEYHVIQIIDYQTKQVVWSYGEGGHPGSGPNQLNTPDDAYQLSNGDVIVADIKNCRVIEISPDHQIVHQYGKTGQCGDKSGELNKPNGDTPLSNGHVYISNIVGHNLVELDDKWQPIFSMNLPVIYPSDPQPTKAGNVLIADYSKPGQVVEVSKSGNIVWKYTGELDHPSLAIELPNGNIMANDDYNHRVVVIDKKTNQIVWQYGVTGKPGSGPGQLSIPDGMDIIPSNHISGTSQPVVQQPTTIGSVTRNAAAYINQTVTVEGYLLKKENNYSIFSDEPTGTISKYDLPVTGTGIDTVQSGQKYVLKGTFLDRGLTASNNNPDHLELAAPPLPAR